MITFSAALAVDSASIAASSITFSASCLVSSAETASNLACTSTASSASCLVFAAAKRYSIRLFCHSELEQVFQSMNQQQLDQSFLGQIR